MKTIAVTMLVGCGSFQDPNVVIDLRVLAMTATVPEQVVDVADPPTAAALLAQLVPSDVCALVADPNFTRRLRWSMTMCNLDNDERCPDDGRPRSELGAGLLDDPDITVPEPQLCVTIPVDGNLIGVVLDVFQNDAFHGLAGLDYGVSLRVGGDTADPDLDLYAAKTVRVSPRIPAQRTANHNPYLDHVDAAVDGGDPAPLPLGRCVDQLAPLVVAPEQVVKLTPVEPDGVREVYVVPAIDGSFRTFTESLTYQWVSSAGSYSSGNTGGPHDPFGNPPPLFTKWTAPKPSDLAGPTDISIWIVQRDERLGAAWYESCIHVTP